VAACLRAIGADGEVAALRKLDARPEWLACALDTLLLGVTDFFRDAKVFEAIEREVLPPLTGRGRAVRVWSAACSEGQELYSVALLLEEMARLDRCELLGSDCRSEAVRMAQTGAYIAAAMAAVPPYLRRQFEYRNGKYHVAERIRRQIRWRNADLLGPGTDGVGSWDMILWRNMAIYLKPQPAERVWRKLTDALAEGGYLITGKAERPPEGLPLQRVVPCVYRRLGDRAWRNV
jgi:chemotaxis methyl-accepting protein methylase